MDTQILKHGEPARLFPVLPDSHKEQKTLSIFLAALTSVRPLAERFFDALDQKVGKRASLSCYTEVTLTNDVKGSKDRPDALIVITSGKKSWSALVEAKVGKHEIGGDQLERYLQLAKINGIDAVITITNQLTPSPRIHPSNSGRSLPKSVDLFHVSWASITTHAFLLASEKEDPFENDDEAFIVSELIRYLEHNASGVVPLDQMNSEWPQIVKSVQSGYPPNPKAPEVSEMVTIWHQEARDVALIMTRRLREPVSIAVSKAFLSDHAAWVEKEIKHFCSKQALGFELDVPNTAGRIGVEADFLRRAVRVSMKVGAPGDRASNGAKLNWLLRQLKNSDLSLVSILCSTKGRGQGFGAMADEFDTGTDEFKALGEIKSFTVEMSTDLSAKFNSRKKFIEELERLVPRFYVNVGQHIKAWTPSPPKVKKVEEKANPAQITENAETVVDAPVVTPEKAAAPQAAPGVSEHHLVERPFWARQWSVPSDSNLETSRRDHEPEI